MLNFKNKGKTMATMCPKCKKEALKKGEKMVYCGGYKPEKVGNEWKNTGSCDFRILLDQKKVFGKTLEAKDIKTVVEGGTLVNGGRKLNLDLTNGDYFVKITKDEDEDL